MLHIVWQSILFRATLYTYSTNGNAGNH